jgi:hypothetical protein
VNLAARDAFGAHREVNASMAFEYRAKRNFTRIATNRKETAEFGSVPV